MDRNKLMLRKGITNDEFRLVVSTNYSKASALKQMGQKANGSNYRWFDMIVSELGIDISHFLGQAYLKEKTHNWSKERSIEDVFIENSTYLATSNLKKKIKKHNLLEEICDECGLQNEWNGKKIVLQLDHRNGINRDNRIENLRYLCPNCHSQTDTYAGKNVKR